MISCKACGNPLVMNLNQRCRSCGARAGLLRSVVGKPTFTQAGAERILSRQRGDSPSGELTWQQAEVMARDWMRQHGHRDARLTTSGADGGVDVRSRKAVAQVKHHIKAVPLGEVQRLYGIAQAEQKAAYFFSTAGYTPKASQWADAHGVACFTLPPVSPVNKLATQAGRKVFGFSVVMPPKK